MTGNPMPVGGWSRFPEIVPEMLWRHVGLAHDQAELEALIAAARQCLAAVLEGAGLAPVSCASLKRRRPC
jgi:hypothetical protein